MLSELQISSLRTIERVNLVLDAGMTALTGETGAGKTMIVEAISLLLGGRAEPSMVRPGAEQAVVHGRFLVGGEEHVITRVVPAKGRSRAYHNDQPVNASRLGELTSTWIELHGQHSHQRLTTTAEQRDALDRWAGIDLGEYRALRSEDQRLARRLDDLGGDDRARQRELDLLRYQHRELSAAALTDSDEELRLEEEADALGRVEQTRELCAQLVELLAADGGAVDLVGQAAHRAGGEPGLSALAGRLHAALAELADVAADARRRTEDVELDEQRIAAVGERRALLRELRHRYGETLGEVIAFHAEVQARLSELEHLDEARASVLAELEACRAKLAAAAATIAAQRTARAGALAATLETRLRTLAMPHAEVAVEVAGPPPGDQVTVLLAANPGLPPAPLAQAASGGELSRAMLALRVELAGEAGTMVFDEVDAGVGGAAADAVGQALAELAAQRQVLVVTHLAQIAARADAQLLIDKRVADGATTTTVSVLDGASRVDEIARLLAGGNDRAAREYAAELLKRLAPRTAGPGGRRSGAGRRPRPTA